MSKQIHTPTYISVGDFHISAEELQKIAPVEAMLLSIIGRSVNAKLKARNTLLDCAADIVLHLYHTIRRQQDFSPSLQEKEIQLKVNNLLKNCLRDMKIKTRNAPYAPLMLKAAYFDAEQRLTDDEEKRDVQAAYIDRSDYNDIAERASTQFDLARLRRAIEHYRHGNANVPRSCTRV